MFLLNISDLSIKIIDFQKNIFGKLGVKSVAKIDLDQESWENKLPKEIQGKKIALCIPDTKIYTYRFEIPADFIGPALIKAINEKVEQTIPVSIDNLHYSFQVLRKTPDSKIQDVLFIAIEKNTLKEYFATFQKTNSKIIFALPESICNFELLKRELSNDGITLYININQKNSVFFIFDKYGPLVTLSQVVETNKLEKETIKLNTYLKKKHNIEVKKILLGEESNLNIDPQAFEKNVGITSIRTETIIQNLFKEFNVKFNYENLKTPYLTLVGLAILFNNKHSFNLFKNENFQKTPNETNIKTEEENKVIDMKNQGNLKEEKTEKLPDVETSNEVGMENNSNNSNKRLKILLAILFISISITAATSISKLNQKNTNTKDKTIETNLANKNISLKPTSTPTIAIKKEELKIQVLNGSGIKGAASILTDLLKEKGYEQIETGNADSYSYSETIIRLKESKKNILDIIVNDLKNDYQISTKSAEIIENNSEYDVIIVIGKE